MLTPIATSTIARRPPTTEVELDGSVLLIRKGRDEALYTVSEFPTNWPGRAFHLERDGGEGHDCFVGRPGESSLCDCRGFERFGHCRHVDALRHLTGRQ